MKNYTITVNGVAYDVTVEEGIGARAASTPVAAPTPAPTAAPAPAPAAAPAPAPAPAPTPAAVGTGAIKVTASVPGKVVKAAASVGQAVKAGDPIVILEAMKMEIPVVAPQDGTVASIDVAAGAAVENGDVLATMN